MGWETRRVPADWVHPLEPGGRRHVPMLDTDMPTGDAWQLYETTSDGTPISPVFASRDAVWAWVASVRRGRTLLQWPDLQVEYMRTLPSADPLRGLFVPSALLRRLVRLAHTDAYRAMGPARRRRARYRVCLGYRAALRMRGETPWAKWPWTRCIRELAIYEATLR